MASLMKFSFLLRDVKVISYQRHSLRHIYKLCSPSATIVENNSIITLRSYSNQNRILNLWLSQQRSMRTTGKYFSEKKEEQVDPSTGLDPPVKKLSIFQRFKAMYRDYWYVLVPVHVITSTFWFGGFYYAAKSGIDIVAFVEKLHLSEAFVEKIRSSGHSTAGYLAISYALYKIFTPLRYTVTLGGTTISINYLKKWGYIKPIPKKEELKKIISDQRHTLREKRLALKDKMIGKLNEKKS